MMHITRIDEAKTYQANNHDNMTCLRLQGKEASPCHQMWMGMSVFEPGGQTGLDGSDVEKIYFVVEGEITVFCESASGEKSEVVLGPNDSCVFLIGEKRQLKNLSNQVAKVVLVMASP
jgi:mannose-6-phosphate isomerase-like protein (cupin superfamily)